MDIKTLFTRADMTFEEAAAYFGERVPVTAKEFYALADEYRGLAFTVSGYTAAQILKRFYEELLAALEEGKTFSEFRLDMNEFLEREGYEGLAPLQADNIFRTNIQTAYHVGHYQQMTDPNVMALRPYWQYDAVNDAHTRRTHLAMDGRVFPADSPVWDIWYPPNGFRCRCTVRTLSERQVKQRGLTVETVPPLDIHPDRNFGTNAAKVRFEPDLTGYPEPLAKAFRAREKAGPGKRPDSAGQHAGRQTG